MLGLVIGIFLGSLATMFTMSLMIVAKRADQRQDYTEQY
ncbi:DUF3789 domain-containing protein [Radiobacillus sp. PE A8.2]